MARGGSSSSLADVARMSGVSTSTVSRVLNNRSDGFSVRDETRQRVLRAAEALSYRPDPIVRSIRAKRTNLVAVLGLRDFGTAIRGTTEEAVNALMRRLYEHRLELCTNIMSPQEPPFAVPRWRVDGAVAVDCSNVRQLDPLDASGVPYVTINGRSGPHGSSVTVDDAAGARDAVHHLMALGHRRIAYAGPDEFNWHESLDARHRAYLQTLEELGLKPVTPELIAGVPPIDVVRTVVLQRRATAIVVYHHMMAVKLVRAAVTLGIRVPQQVSLICFNDLFPCQDLVPSLTSMRLPSGEMGEVAADILLEQLEAGEDAKPRHVVLQERLIIRESTAPAPSE